MAHTVATMSMLWEKRVSDELPNYAVIIMKVKGLPEGRPALEMGDTVFLRAVATDEQGGHVEYTCVVMAVDSTRAMLLPPPVRSSFPPNHVDGTIRLAARLSSG
eukprot:scaffold372701_cov18-Prasinocladus_malaysianus.AAC.1